jgi:eukaryotic-like serine/threonine-protein kinase
MTRTGTVLGTSNYIAPEQAAGAPVQAQTDVYSLGVVLFELLTGDVPFDGGTFVAVALRHVNEPPPSVLEVRPDVPVRVANAVDRALEKDPRDRFPSMDAFVDELESCLGGLGEPAEHATEIRRAPLVRPSRPRRRSRARSRLWPVAALLVGLAVLAAVVVAALALRGDGDENPGGGGNGAGGETPAGTAVGLEGVRALDPSGDGEHDDEAGNAADGDRATAWRTERYRFPDGGLGKQGVGVVLDAGREVRPRELTVVTDTPGFTADVLAGNSETGPFNSIAGGRPVAETTTFDVDGEPARYYVVWITNRGENASVRVNEVSARS